MVNEPRLIVKSDFFTADMQPLYNSMCERVRMHKDNLYMACCTDATKAEYIFYGTYPRKKVIDARITGYHNGVPEIETLILKDFKIQRLMHKDCGHTHALMFEWFIPYQNYSIRFVLLHLQRYFLLGDSIEYYCLENEIPVTAFRRWLEWLKENLGILTHMGVVRDRNENKENLMKWLSAIIKDISLWVIKSLSNLNRVLFQRHNMPAGYMNYRIRIFKNIPLPTDPAFDI